MPNLDETGANEVVITVDPANVWIAMRENDCGSHDIEILLSHPLPCECMDKLDAVLHEKVPHTNNCIGEGPLLRKITSWPGEDIAHFVQQLAQIIKEALQEFVSRIIPGMEPMQGRSTLYYTLPQYA